MNTSFKNTLLCVATVFALGVGMHSTSHAQSAQNQGNEYTPKGLQAFIVPIALEVGKEVVTSIFRSILQPIANWFTSDKKADVGVSNPSSSPSQGAQVNQLPQAEKVFADSNLDSGSKKPLPTLIARVTKVNEQGKLLDSITPEQNVMQTGERFIIEYRANMPGMVISQHKDPKGVVTDMDLNQMVGPIVNNKLPTDDYSYNLQGDTGVESFRILFAPCLDAGKANENTLNKDLGEILASATAQGGTFYSAKGVTKVANQKTSSHSESILTPVAMKSLTGCDRSQIDGIAKQDFGVQGSKFGVQGQASIAQGNLVGQVVELIIKINHQSTNSTSKTTAPLSATKPINPGP